MAIPHHPDIEVVPGDDWAIHGTLVDYQNNPVDLTNLGISWTLIGPDGEAVLTDTASYISLDPNNLKAGVVDVLVPKAVTGTLDCGFYFDAIRVISGDLSEAVTSVQWIGVLQVDEPIWFPTPTSNILYALLPTSLAVSAPALDLPTGG